VKVWNVYGWVPDRSQSPVADPAVLLLADRSTRSLMEP
jgi:hypothetical protein